MQITAQEILPVLERAKALAFVDIEAANLNADYGTVVVVSIKPYKSKSVTFTAVPGRDKQLLRDVSTELIKYPVWITFFGKRYDIPFLNSRLIYHGLPLLPKHHHIDMWMVMKMRTHLSRRNQAHLLSWLGTPEEKMSVSPTVWSEMSVKPKEKLEILRKRCESDVAGLEAMYERAKGAIGEITR